MQKNLSHRLGQPEHYQKHRPQEGRVMTTIEEKKPAAAGGQTDFSGHINLFLRKAKVAAGTNHEFLLETAVLLEELVWDTSKSLVQNKEILNGKIEAFLGAHDLNSIDTEVLRMVAKMTYNHRHGLRIFETILMMDVIWYEDFLHMSKDWQNISMRITWITMQKFAAAATYSGRRYYAVGYGNPFAHKGVYSWWLATKELEFGN